MNTIDRLAGGEALDDLCRLPVRDVVLRYKANSQARDDDMVDVELDVILKTDRNPR